MVADIASDRDKIDAAIRFYAANYEIDQWIIGSRQSKLILGNRVKRRCRFCNRAYPEVTFSNEAHAIPQLMGNRHILTVYECDSCNDIFGRTIDNDLGHWLLPFRLISGIRGKKKYPSFKSEDGKTRLDTDGGGMKVDHHPEDGVFVVDHDSRTMKFNIKRHPYNPLNVMRAFVKIGISLVREDRLRYFDSSLALLRPLKYKTAEVRIWPVNSYFIPGPSFTENTVIMMLYRKSDYVRMPYCMLFIKFGAQSFQIVIPASQKDFPVATPSFELPLLPLFDPDDIERYGVPVLSSINLHEDTIIRDDVVRLGATYDDYHDIGANEG